LIEITGLTKTYPGNVPALRGLDLKIGAGMFGLVGPNGAGKTSLMRILAGLVRPTSGSVRVFGYDVTTSAGKLAVKARLGYLPQELGLYPNLTGREFLDYIALLKGITHAPTRRRQIMAALEKVRLVEVANRQLRTYSGGMKRRIGVAQAILGDPKLLILDEPTVGLDPEERLRLRNLLSEIATRCSVILSTHIIEDISQSCRDLAAIEQGQVLFHGSPQELMAQARGKVWTLSTAGEPPNGELAIISSVQLPDTIQYRVLGAPAAHYNPTPVEPNLEDGYMWLMRERAD
jgi:ABC-type multidrug transport system ATPase subunit